MYEERLLIKESSADYIAAIAVISVIYAALLGVSAALFISAGGIAGDICAIAAVVVLSAAYIFLLMYCIFSMRRKYFEFYEDRVTVLCGDRKIYMFFYSDIKDCADCGRLGLKITTGTCYHYKRGELNGKRFCFVLAREDKKKVLEMLRKAAENQ